MPVGLKKAQNLDPFALNRPMGGYGGFGGFWGLWVKGKHAPTFTDLHRPSGLV